MKQKHLIFFAVLAASFLLTSFVYAAVPHLIRFQGKVTDKAGAPLNGSYNITFRLYDAETGGQLKWNETQSGVPVNNGIFTVLLGNVTSLNLAFDAPYWLSIEVGSDGEMTPRQAITSVGYAIHAETAENFLSGSAGLVPSGAIILWTGASCPSGYSRVGELDGKFIVGGAMYNANAGGNEKHTHGGALGSGVTGNESSHTHSTGAGGAQVAWGASRGGAGDQSDASNGYHTHAVGGGSAHSHTIPDADSRPPFATVLFCRKN